MSSVALKTSHDLNVAVARALGLTQRDENGLQVPMSEWQQIDEAVDSLGAEWITFEPSRRWDQGGPILQRERVDVWFEDGLWHAEAPRRICSGRCVGSEMGEGATFLEAGMRAVVASRLADSARVQ